MELNLTQRILYIYNKDPKNRMVQSGRPYAMYEMLKEKGNVVDLLIIDDYFYRILYAFIAIIYKLNILTTEPIRNSLVNLYSAYKVKKELKKKIYSYIFSPTTTIFLKLDNVKVIKISCCDTLVPGLYEFYYNHNYLSDLKAEEECLNNIDYLLMPTKWSEKQLSKLNSKNKPKVIISPFGYSICIDKIQTPEDKWKSIYHNKKINFITIISDWERKGGDITLKILFLLKNKINIDISLHIVGELNKRELSGINNFGIDIILHGKINKNDINSLNKFNNLLDSSHFFILPSRGEAFGISVCEAKYFGIPTLVSNNGGIGEIIENEVDGFILNNDDNLTIIVDKIADLINFKYKYIEMSYNAKSSSEMLFNWSTFYNNTFLTIFQKNNSEILPKKIRVAYVTIEDSNDIHVWSGSTYNISNALSKVGIDIIPIGNLNQYFILYTKFKVFIYRRFFKKNHLYNRDKLYIKNISNQILKKLKNIDYDWIITPGSLPICFLNSIKKPILLWTDAVFAGMIDFYPEFSNLSNESLLNGNLFEQLALDNCRFAVFSSEWAAQSALDNYLIDAEKIKVITFGSNIECNRNSDSITLIAESKTFETCKLLFIGKDWYRKGGDKALDITIKLNAIGLKTELHVVGCQPPEILPEFVKLYGFLSKKNNDSLLVFDELMRTSHFLLVPSIAECAAVVFAEASSWGMPSISTNVGGIPSVIKDDINGKTFNIYDPADLYCKYIENLMNSPDKYRILCNLTFNEYKNNLNWNVAAKSIYKLVSEDHKS